MALYLPLFCLAIVCLLSIAQYRMLREERKLQLLEETDFLTRILEEHCPRRRHIVQEPDKGAHPTAFDQGVKDYDAGKEPVIDIVSETPENPASEAYIRGWKYAESRLSNSYLAS